MKLRNLFILGAVVSLVYAVAALLVPVTLLTTYGISAGPAEQLMTRFFGGALGGLGLILWLAKDVADLAAQRAITLASFVFSVVGLVVSLQGTRAGVMGGVGWSAVAINGFFALAWGYFRFGKPKPA
ncbi:MAG: hypothetical protein ACREMR_02745 [Gemmatimonadales bacterium]